MQNRFFLFLTKLLTLCTVQSFGQINSISSTLHLNDSLHILSVQQRIVFHNQSKKNLKNIYLHNWANSFKNNKTPLGKRFIEDYRKSFYFAKKEERGYSEIKNLSVDFKKNDFYEKNDQPDVVVVPLTSPLKPKDSITLSIYYRVKIPNARFTGYGKTRTGYHLRFWQIIPAVYQEGWQLMSNLNMDDLFQDIANYKITLQLPETYHLESNLYQYKEKKNGKNSYYLVGNQKKDIILSIDKRNKFTSFKTKTQEIKTDAFDKKISTEATTKIIQKQINFIEQYIGKHPHVEMLVDASTVRKNALHEIYGLPSWLKPFPENFRWEVNFFKALSSKYIDDIVLHNKRTDYWFVDGLQTFLMMEYLKKYYPGITVLGKYSKYWPLRTYNISKLKQNDRFAFVYQFSARRFYDQSLNTRADSLSNFNRNIVGKYKSGLGFKYLQDYLGKEVFQKSIRQYLFSNNLKKTPASQFLEILKENTTKDLDWFAGDYLKTSKKIDYKITNITTTKNTDSLKVTIKNKRNFPAPVALYGIKKRKIIFKQWVPKIDSVATISIKNSYFDKLALNYENSYPEYNSLDNFRKKNNTLIHKPLQLRFLKDMEDPYYNQLFFYPDFKYNLYDGVILGMKINNRSLIPHNFNFTLTPNYSTKSQNFTGAFSFGYDHFFQNSSIYKIRYGIGGSNFHYAPELGYHTFIPSISIAFRRKTLRDVGSKSLTARLFYINKEVAPGEPVTEEDKYQVLNFRFLYSKPNIIKRLRYAANLEIGNNFTKLSTDLRYQEFFSASKSFELRFFGGMFITNNSVGDYFSFGLNRSSDYLFEQSLFGRSESSGLFSQQFIVSDAGFKSKYDTEKQANQFILAGNTSIGLWKWFEVYNDVAMLKNKSESPTFYYENGIRLNFIPEIFEFYLPVYNNQGWEINQPAYANKIRFVITTNLDRIYNFIRRGIL